MSVDRSRDRSAGVATPRLVAEAVTAMRRMPVVPDDAAWAHGEAMKALSAAGFTVRHEVRVCLEGGRHGRLDIVASKCGVEIAIEIDSRIPRARSLEKLRGFEGGRIVALRGIKPECRFEGIDAIVALRTRGASRREKGDKSRVLRAAREIAS